MKQASPVTMNTDLRAAGAVSRAAAAPTPEPGQDIKLLNVKLSQTVLPHPSRQQLIAETAYHYAEARCFAPGHALDDWLAAEADVTARLDGEGCCR